MKLYNMCIYEFIQYAKYKIINLRYDQSLHIVNPYRQINLNSNECSTVRF